MNVFILFSFIGVAFIRWSIYFLVSLQILIRPKNKSDNIPTAGVSIIIAAKNEEQHLKRLIPQLLEQDYPEFEIIIVNDFSTDKTQEVLQSISNEKLKIIHAERDQPGKKFALDQAIRSSKYEYLLFTDADCVPSHRNWVKIMISQAIQNNKSIVLGFSPVVLKNTVSGWLSRYETLHNALLYLGAAVLGHPYMGVGRNLLYTKSLYLQNSGFTTHNHIPSGDDDLQVQKMASRNNTTICLNDNAWTYTFPPSNFLQYIRQKLRHVSVATNYLPRYQMSLMLLAILHFLFYGLLFLSWFFSGYDIFTVYGIWIFAMVMTLFNVGRKFKDQIIAWGFPILDIILLLLNMMVGFILIVDTYLPIKIHSHQNSSDHRGF